jgi:molecular chaperone Hsp33
LLWFVNGQWDPRRTNDTITIRTEDGPVRGIVAIVTGTGEARGYVGTPMLGNNWTLSEAVGKVGSVQIVKNHPSWPRPYNGITAIRYGDIDRDVGIYLAESEQSSCALAA